MSERALSEEDWKKIPVYVGLRAEGFGHEDAVDILTYDARASALRCRARWAAEEMGRQAVPQSSAFAPGRRVPGRAEAPEEKRAIVEKLLQLWLRRPYKRLGQLLHNYAGPRDGIFVAVVRAVLEAGIQSANAATRKDAEGEDDEGGWKEVP